MIRGSLANGLIRVGRNSEGVDVDRVKEWGSQIGKATLDRGQAHRLGLGRSITGAEVF
jgi:hypothetical protein